jgi:hypothetical protein
MRMATGRIGILASAMALAACAGDGSGLDEVGRSTGEILTHRPDQARADSLFGIIQGEIFTPICVRCHFLPYAPYGMSLEADRSRLIVGRPSNGHEGMRIVVPGDPSRSYLLWKLEGRSGITGFRMPFGMEPLPESQMRTIRSWINSL